MKTYRTILVSIIFFSISMLHYTIPKKSDAPEGTVKINDTLYYDATEVSIKQWKAFEKWTIEQFGSNSKEHLSILPNMKVWKEEISSSKEYVEGYYTNEKFDEMPIVGISWEQAKKYCKWKTEMANKNTDGVKYNFRLPTSAEWEMLAKAGYSEKFQKYIDKKNYTFNKLHNIVVYDTSYDASNAEPHFEYNPDATITAPVNMYLPNKYGVFNLFGNVAEMTSEKGIAKGGGWNHIEAEVGIDKSQSYSGATAWLGFRCVCDIEAGVN